jgi:hypothetical protein
MWSFKVSEKLLRIHEDQSFTAKLVEVLTPTELEEHHPADILSRIHERFS